MELENLISKAKNRDSEAFGELYDVFAEPIFRFIKIRVQNQQHAEDILQEVFLKAWNGLEQIDPKKFNFKAWLYTIAQNAIIDHYRRVYRKPENAELNENIDVESGVSLEDELQKQGDIARIKQALTQLPPSYRQVLELRFLQDFTITETAAILKKTNLSIRLAQHRGLAKLKALLRDDHDMGYQKI